MSLPNLLDSADINTCIETPAVRIDWTWSNPMPYDAHDPFDADWYVPWVRTRLVSNEERFPIDYTDGTLEAAHTWATDRVNNFVVYPTANTYTYVSQFIEQPYYGHYAASWSTPTGDLARQFSIIYGRAVDRVDPFMDTLWYAGIDHSGKLVVNSVDIRDSDNIVFTREIDVTGILAATETFVGIGDPAAYGTTTKSLPVITSTRVLVLDISTEDVMTDDQIVWSLSLTSTITAGHVLGDGIAYFTGGNYVFLLLDTENQEVAAVYTSGAPVAVYDYSSLIIADSIHSVGYDLRGDGAGQPWVCLMYWNKILKFDPTGAPWLEGSVTRYWDCPVQLAPRATIVDTTGATEKLIAIEEESKSSYSYDNALDFQSNYTYAHDWYEDDVTDTIGLFHLEDTAGAVATDSAATGNGVYTGVTLNAPGRHQVCYTKGIQVTGNNQYIACATQAPLIKGDTGTIEFYYRPTSSLDWGTAGTKRMVMVRHTVSGDLISIYMVGDTLYAQYKVGANTYTISGLPMTGTQWRHIALVWDVVGVNITMYLYLDGTTYSGGVANVGGASAGYNTCYLAGAPIGLGDPCMIGYYDEFRISIVDRTVYNYSANTFHHNSFKLHEWSGRDYLTWFPGQRPFSFNQDLFDKYIPEAVRNRDTNMVQWVMKAVGLTNEYIYWTQTKTTGGHLESLSTFWGLLADRIADARDRVIVDQDVDTVSHRHISQLAKLIGYEDVVPILNPITTDELSMDKFRKAVKKLALLWKRKGTLHGLRQFMRMYDIALDIDVTYYRRFWDSVVDPLRSDIPLDSTPMDTYFSTQPIGEIGIRAYYMARNIDMDSNGVTGAAGTSTFTSAGATWLTNATIVSPGDMLSVQDYTAINNPANGEYRVLTVPLGTQVTVDHSWTAAQGGLNNIIFQLWKYLPVEDPAAEFTMNMLRLLIPYNMILVYNDPT